MPILLGTIKKLILRMYTLSGYNDKSADQLNFKMYILPIQFLFFEYKKKNCQNFKILCI